MKSLPPDGPTGRVPEPRGERFPAGVTAAFLAECLAVGGGLLSYGLTGMSAPTRLFTSLAGLASVAFVICHGFRTLGGRRLAGFLVLAAVLGFSAELVSVHGVSLFGESYRYPEERWKGMVLGVPVAAAVFWAVFIYGGHSIVNGFLAFSGMEDPAACATRGAPFLVPLLATADACVVTSIDLFMDPITTLRGNWVWAAPGAFFGVPVGNFAGWFAVSFAVCAAFRTYAHLRPAAPRPHIPDAVHLMPGLSYLLLAVVFTTFCCSAGRLDIALAGLAAMGPVSVLLPVCFFGRQWGRTGVRSRFARP